MLVCFLIGLALGRYVNHIDCKGNNKRNKSNDER